MSIMISYTYNTNRNKISVTVYETDDPARALERADGPVRNGITPSYSGVFSTVETAAAALDVIYAGGPWVLAYVDRHGTADYELRRVGDRGAFGLSGHSGVNVQIIARRSSSGLYTAHVNL